MEEAFSASGRLQAISRQIQWSMNQYSVAHLVSMLESNVLDVAAAHSRRDVWDSWQKSLYVESLVLGLPMAPLYMAEEDHGQYVVLDGVQRLLAIRDFAEDRLTLTRLPIAFDLEGCKFSDLSFDVRHIFLDGRLPATVVWRGTDSGLRALVFERLNTTGAALNAQEVRNALYQGPLNELIVRLSQTPFYKDQVEKRASSRVPLRMLDVEYVLRFLAAAFGEPTIRNTSRGLNEFMARGWSISREELRAYEEAFLSSLRHCQEIWQEDAFMLPAQGSARRPHFSAHLFVLQMYLCLRVSEESLAALRVLGRASLQAATSNFTDGRLRRLPLLSEPIDAEFSRYLEAFLNSGVRLSLKQA